MQKILLIGNSVSMMINFRRELIVLLKENGYQVYCMVNECSEVQKSEIENLGAVLVQHHLNTKGVNPIADLRAAYDFFKKIQTIKPDIVFPFFVKPVIFGGLAAHWAKVPRVVGMLEGLGNVFTVRPGKTSWKVQLIKNIQVALYRFSLPKLDALIVLNSDDKKDLLDKYQIPTKTLHILGGIGVDLEKFPYSKPDLTKPVSFIFIARLLREKGIFEYLQAAKQVKKQYSQVIFRIIGGFDVENPFALKEDVLDDFIQNGIVEYPGFVHDVSARLADSSVFVLPSYREGMSRSTQEAMAIGRAVIITDVPGCRETVVDGVNGFLIPPFSAEALAEKMIYFIENPQAVLSMGEASRKMAEEKFNIYEVNRRLLAILEDF